MRPPPARTYHRPVQLLLLVLTLSAAATPEPPAKQRVKELFESARAAFDQERFDESARLFLEAKAMVEREGLPGRVALAFNAGVASLKGGACALAVSLFEELAAADPGKARSADFEQQMGEAKRCAGELTVTSTPSGAALAVDGTARGSTPARVYVDAGEHQIALTLAGHLGASTTISIGKGAQRRSHLVLTPDPKAVAQIPVAAEVVESRSFPWYWVSGGAAVAAIGVGVTLFVVSRGQYNDFLADDAAQEAALAAGRVPPLTLEEWQDRQSAPYRTQSFAVVALLVGGVAAAATVAQLVFGGEPDPGSAPSSGAGQGLSLAF